MDDDGDRILSLLADIGIDAKIVTNNTLEELIAIPTEQFEQRRRWVERWFVLVEQHKDYCYFRVRLRGTGDTL